MASDVDNYPTSFHFFLSFLLSIWKFFFFFFFFFRNNGGNEAPKKIKWGGIPKQDAVGLDAVPIDASVLGIFTNICVFFASGSLFPSRWFLRREQDNEAYIRDLWSYEESNMVTGGTVVCYKQLIKDHWTNNGVQLVGLATQYMEYLALQLWGLYWELPIY